MDQFHNKTYLTEIILTCRVLKIKIFITQFFPKLLKIILVSNLNKFVKQFSVFEHTCFKIQNNLSFYHKIMKISRNILDM